MTDDSYKGDVSDISHCIFAKKIEVMACFVGQLLAPAEGFDQGQNAIIFFAYFLPILVLCKNQEK